MGLSRRFRIFSKLCDKLYPAGKASRYFFEKGILELANKRIIRAGKRSFRGILKGSKSSAGFRIRRESTPEKIGIAERVMYEQLSKNSQPIITDSSLMSE